MPRKRDGEMEEEVHLIEYENTWEMYGKERMNKKWLWVYFEYKLWIFLAISLTFHRALWVCMCLLKINKELKERTSC